METISRSFLSVVHQNVNILTETISLLAFCLIKMSSCAESARLTASSVAPSRKEQWGWHPHLWIAFPELHQSFPTLDTGKRSPARKSGTTSSLLHAGCCHHFFFKCVYRMFKTKNHYWRNWRPESSIVFLPSSCALTSQALTLPVPNSFDGSQPWGRELASLMKPRSCQDIWSAQYCYHRVHIHSTIMLNMSVCLR